MVNVTGQLPPGVTLAVVKSSEPHRPRPRAYSPAQLRTVAAGQDERNALATEIVHASGIRAHELLTLGRPDDRRGRSHLTCTAAEGMKFAGRDGVVYTIVGKGGLVREGRERRAGPRGAIAVGSGGSPRSTPPGRSRALRRLRRPLSATLRRRRRACVQRVVLTRQHRGAWEEPVRARTALRVRPIEDAGTHAPRGISPRARHRLGGMGHLRANATRLYLI